MPGIPADPGQQALGRFPEHLATHYLSLSIDELTAEQLRHYQRLWRRIETLVTAHAPDADASRLIFEGSGVLPELVATLNTLDTAAVWLTASASVLRNRVYSASRFYERTAAEKAMAEKFPGRTDRFNQVTLGAVNSLGFASIDASAAPPTSELIQQCLQAIG